MNKSLAPLVKELFGDRKLSTIELWALVKMFRIVRLRCRNNSALNNQLSAAFPHATFRMVPKVRPASGIYPEKHYQGLSITVPGEMTPANVDDSED